MVSMWEQIRSNRRRSIVLAAAIALLLMVMGFVFGEAYFSGGGVFGLLVALAVWSVMSLVAYFQGDRILLGVSGAREIKKGDHPQLFNVVEEMQIAAGLPKMPRVYVIDSMGLNAFATGRKPENAAVAVTAGLLAKLNRDQLQGVIAHEMSHIVNRDVLFMTMISIMLGAIVMISEVFLRSLWFSGGRSSRRYNSSSKGGGQAQAIMMVVAIVMAILAPILAYLIYFAISRRREYLADANAAVLTRYPPGLASALDVLRGDTHVLEHANKATAPMYIINPLHKAGMKAAELSSTHPPIEERIRILMGMGGAVSYGAYEQAFQRTTKRGSVMPQSALKGDQAQPMRAALAVDEAPKTARQRTREAGDLLRKVNKFAFLTCECGLRLKLPPEMKQQSVKCPRCHKKLAVPKTK